MSQATYDGENGTHSRPMWRPTNAPVASSRTDDIWFLDPQRGWAVNSNGQIVHTGDGFATWEQQFHDPQVYLRRADLGEQGRSPRHRAPAR
ncbi:MAG: hypothetical protein ACRDSL_21860 [Pseudonocardiaceae bacterium]